VDSSADYDLSDELTRKSGEAYSWLDNEFRRGQISSQEFRVALIALDIALIGLIPKQYSEWAASMRLLLEKRPERDRSVYYTDDRLVVLTLDREHAVVRVAAILRKPGVQLVTKEYSEKGDSEWAAEKYRSLRSEVEKKGFVELI